MDHHDQIDQGSGGAAVATLPRPASPRVEQPRLWNVILMDDDHHSYEYVIRMLMELFGKPLERAFQMANEVDDTGRVICTTVHKELAELKQPKIHAFCTDPLHPRCRASTSATTAGIHGGITGRGVARSGRKGTSRGSASTRLS